MYVFTVILNYFLYICPKLFLHFYIAGLVVLTTMAGYAIAPAAFDLSGFLFCSLGTALISCSANSINQVFEVPYDSQMDRTKNRVLVRGKSNSITFCSCNCQMSCL